MKKSLIALAALATVGAAQAQSSVTVYGIIDAGYVSSTNKIDGGAKVSKDIVQGGNASTNRLGFRGVEDLGGGLSAGFVAESALGALNAQSGNNSFLSSSQSSGNRQTFVYLDSKSFGKLNVGYTYTATHLTRLSADPTGGANMPGNLAVAVGIPGTVSAYVKSDATAAAAQNAASNGSTLTNADYSPRANQISYESPRISGVQIGFGVTENTIKSDTSGTVTNSSVNGYSTNLNYVAGKLSAAVTYAEATTKSGSAGAEAKVKNTSVAAAYNLGFATASAVYWNDKLRNNVAATAGTKDVENQGYQASIIAPVSGTKVRVFATYADGDYTLGTPLSAGNGLKRDQKGMQLGAYYDLSKRTTAYALYGEQERKDLTNTKTNKDEAIAVGLRHSF